MVPSVLKWLTDLRCPNKTEKGMWPFVPSQADHGTCEPTCDFPDDLCQELKNRAIFARAFGSKPQLWPYPPVFFLSWRSTFLELTRATVLGSRQENGQPNVPICPQWEALALVRVPFLPL